MDVALLVSSLVAVIVVAGGIVYSWRVQLSPAREQLRPFALWMLVGLEWIFLGLMFQQAHKLGWVLSGDDTSNMILNLMISAFGLGTVISLFAAIAKVPPQANETDMSRPREPAQ